MISLKNDAQIAQMRSAGHLLYDVLQQVKEIVVPGISTWDIHLKAESLIRAGGAIPSSLGYSGFPASVCTSVDSMVVHGIPSKTEILKEGSIVSIDATLLLDGWQADSCLTVGVGEVSPEAQKLMDVTQQCFFAGAREAMAGKRLGDIGSAVQNLAESHGYGVIRDYTGHGIGREMHEDPTVYNFGQAGKGLRLRKGMTICIEPMIAAGDWRVRNLSDGWGVRTADGSLCSHYEHTVAINEQGLPELLTYPGFVWEEEG